MLDHFRGAAREFFLLEQARQESAKLSVSQRDSIATLYRAATRRIDVARGLREPHEVHAALSLYRGAVLLLTYAVLTSRDPRVDLDGLSSDAAFDKLSEVLKAEARGPTAVLGLARRLVAGPEPLAVDRLSAGEAACAVEDLQLTARWLRTLFEQRSPRQLRWMKLVRIAGSIVLAGAALTWAGWRITAPNDIARGKTAHSSSTDLGTEARGAVDGVKDGRFGFHSQMEDAPWWSVDLERPHSLKTIKVFGRGDCCYDQSVPLALDVSDDGTSYRRVAERTEAFSESNPWVIKPSSVVARFVRLRSANKANLVLGEVEIYEK